VRIVTVMMMNKIRRKLNSRRKRLSKKRRKIVRRVVISKLRLSKVLQWSSFRG
jgi:hypothetical protein